MAKKTDTSFPLDISAILHMGTRLENYSNMFRQDVVLKEEVDPEILQQALNNLAPRFPTIIAGIHSGFFAHSIIPSEEVPQVQPDDDFMKVMSDEEIEECAVRIKYKGRKIVLECFHSISDGYGGFVFMHSLAAEYLRLKHGVKFTASDTLCLPEDPVRAEEVSDDYLRYAKRTGWFADRVKAYKMVKDIDDDTQIHHCTDEIDTKELLGVARKYGVSMTAFLVAVQIYTIFQFQQEDTEENKKSTVRIMVPVDLRRVFPSISVRNFLLYVMPGVRLEDELTFSELVAEVATQMKELSTPEELRIILSMNANLQRYWISKAIPLWIKQKIMRFGYSIFGEVSSTMTMSNLGTSMVPEEMKPYIESEHSFLTPRLLSGANCCVNSYGDKTFINATWRGNDTAFEDRFFANLREFMAKDFN